MLLTGRIGINVRERNAIVGMYSQDEQLQHVSSHSAMHTNTVQHVPFLVGKVVKCNIHRQSRPVHRGSRHAYKHSATCPLPGGIGREV